MGVAAGGEAVPGTPGPEEQAARLERERDMLQAMLDTTHAQLAYLDLEFNFVAVNAAYAHGCGYAREALIGRNHFALFPHPENEAIFARVRDTGEPAAYTARPFEFPNRPELGTTYWDWTLRPVHNAQGSVEGVLLSLVDVTEDVHLRAERERLIATLERYTRRLQLLHETDRAILEAETIADIAAVALKHLAGVTRLQRGSVALYDWAASRMSLAAVVAERSVRLAPGWSAPLDAVWFIEALKQGHTYKVEDLAALDLSSPWLEALRAEGERTFICLPLIVGGELIGALSLGGHSRGALGPEEEEIVGEIAHHLAIALRQARLEAEVRRHAQELEDLVVRRTARLQASEARLRSIFEEAPIGIALADPSGRIRQSNPVLRQILRCTGKDLAQKKLSDLIAPQQGAPCEQMLAALVSGRQHRCRAELRVLREDGSTLWANMTACLVRGARGRPRFVLAMLEDITERKEAAAALLQAEKLAVAGRLAASLTHEINNPLQSVMGCLGLAQEALAAGEGAGRFLEVALEELRRAGAIVSRLRDLQRRSPREDRSPADLGTLVEHVLTLTARRCADHRIAVDWQPQPGLPRVPVVTDHIRQVFLNVVLNAIEAMPDGGRLAVRMAATAGPAGIATSFSDTGVGMAPEVLEHLFEPFFSTRADGLGLGLHVSRNIVQDHGGRIDVASELGRGTTFTVWLPAQ